ncbi:hypothetical protein [Rubrolithibacter danxiaensis]|uniref:hypothetical protein n=1 Tax=Rubrolithibacter danxiaensis TaxID=3390805 RepID=UPI003BF79A97
MENSCPYLGGCLSGNYVRPRLIRKNPGCYTTTSCADFGFNTYPCSNYGIFTHAILAA